MPTWMHDVLSEHTTSTTQKISISDMPSWMQTILGEHTTTTTTAAPKNEDEQIPSWLQTVVNRKQSTTTAKSITFPTQLSSTTMRTFNSESGCGDFIFFGGGCRNIRNDPNLYILPSGNRYPSKTDFISNIHR